jgi:regulation of enolase protein 1 (concanavalin A-like superfamily)
MRKVKADSKVDIVEALLTSQYHVGIVPANFKEYAADVDCNGEINLIDAGALFVYDSDKKWIKLAFENTDLGYPSVVAVVTHRVSDDSNGEKIEGKSVWLQVVRRKDTWCLHYSYDKAQWKMIRYFYLPMKRTIRIGMLDQSPLGNGCTVCFRNFEIIANTYKDIRKAE